MTRNASAWALSRLLAATSRLGFKIVLAVVVVAIIPLVVSAFLVGQVVRVSDSVAEGQLRRLSQPLDRAADAYRRLFRTTKERFQLEAENIARDEPLLEALQRSGGAERKDGALAVRLNELVAVHARLHELVITGGGGAVLARARSRRFPGANRVRFLRIVRPLAAEPPMTLAAVFATDRRPFRDFHALGAAQRTASEIAGLRSELSGYYRIAFLLMFGAALLVAMVSSLLIARRTVKRVGVLVGATRAVAAGNLETRVDLNVRDEIGELAESFNEMVRQLRATQDKVAYLERISAWQEVAKRLAHQIKNPLTPIQLAVQQLHQRYSREDEAFARTLDEACEIVTEEVGALRRLVEAFSSFSKLPAVRLEPIDLNSLVDDFIKSYGELAARANVSWRPASEPCFVAGDRMLLKHVLYNLIDNAVQVYDDATSQEPLAVTISVSSARAHGWATMLVCDNGPGIEASAAARVFEPYFTQRSGGTGLGLAIVKKIVLEHRGSVSVESEPGQGARFILRLPLVSAPAPRGDDDGVGDASLAQET